MQNRRVRFRLPLSLMLAGIGLLVLPSPLSAQQDDGMPSPGGAGGQPQSVEPGTFTNEDIGYSILIPEGFTGMSMPQPANVLIVSELALGSAAGQARRQFMVAYSSEEQADEMIPDFENGDLQEVQRMLLNSNRGAGPQAQLNIEETTRAQIGGRRGVRITSTSTAPGSDQTMSGVMYAINHRGGALVIQYFADEHGDQLESFAEQNIATLSLQ